MLDIRTLVIALTTTFVLQAIIFLLMTLFINTYKGLRLWSYGCFCLALNFISIYLRSKGFHVDWMIVISNYVSITGLLCFYNGTKQFLNLPFKQRGPILSTFFYLLGIGYFTFIDNDINIRIILFSIMMASILLKNVQILIQHSKKSFKASAWILASLFTIMGILLVYRAGYTYFHPITDNGFFDSSMQGVTMLVSLSLSLIWTQGVIMLVNQKLQGELTDKTKELEATNREKDKFFSILAHDLRGPLTTIMGMVDLMADQKSDLGEELMREMAGAMKTTVHSTNTLLDNLLDWASLQRGLKTAYFEQTTYGELMDAIRPPLLIQAETKNITFIDEIPPQTPIYTDLKMVQSIFRNLITNAIKFTPAQGTIRLFSSTSNEGFIQFAVSDNGIGMSKDFMKHLFEVGPKNRRLGTGGEHSTGLGLMICKEFIEKLGGHIWVESEVKKGSTFRFCLENNVTVSCS